MDELLPTARDLMSDDYLTVRPSLALLDAVKQLESSPEDTAFVLDDQSVFLGVLTELECLRVLAARAYDGAIAETVRDVMKPPAVTVSPETDAYAVAQAFLTCGCGMLPVMDNEKVIGAVSRVAMLRVFIEIFRHRTVALGEIEQTADDMSHRPESKEQMQRVSANLERDQLASLFRQTVRKDE